MSRFVKSLREMPLPRGLTDKDGPAFSRRDGKSRSPMEDRVVETLAQAKDATANLQVFNGTRLKTQHELDRLNQKPNTQHLIGISDLNIVVPDIRGGIMIKYFILFSAASLLFGCVSTGPHIVEDKSEYTKKVKPQSLVLRKK